MLCLAKGVARRKVCSQELLEVVVMGLNFGLVVWLVQQTRLICPVLLALLFSLVCGLPAALLKRFTVKTLRQLYLQRRCACVGEWLAIEVAAMSITCRS